jgi:hypothetical protein
MLRRTLTLLALGVSTLAVVPPAVAASSAVTDCSSHGRLTQHYTVGQLRTALDTMPADVQEYTNCYTVIHDQILAQIPGRHAGVADSSGGGSSFLSTPLLVVLIVLLVGGGALAGLAIQRRGDPPSDG